MGHELSLLIGSIAGGTGALLSFWAGWRARDRQGPPRGSYGLPPRYRPGYHSINFPDPSPDRRPTNPFNGEPVTLTESSVQRGNGNGGPTTSKPQPAGGRLITRTPFNESITQRGNGNGGPTTPKPEIMSKPQPAGGRLIGADGVPIDHQPRPSRPGANPPPSES
jgi:hypothetical protein